jgi:hypothetical protein
MYVAILQFKPVFVIQLPMEQEIWSKAACDRPLSPEAGKFHPVDTLQLAYTASNIASTILELLWRYPPAE